MGVGFREKRKNFIDTINEANLAEATNRSAVIPSKSSFAKLQTNYPINNDFNPNIASKEIAHQQSLEFIKKVIGTSYEKFIVCKSEKVQELLDYLKAIILYEDIRLNDDNFPLEIHTRIKANPSLFNKIDRWSKRDDKQGIDISDYIACRILPQKTTPILDANGDSVLQEMLDRRDKVNDFLTDTYRGLSKKPNITCEDYCMKCLEAIEILKNLFPDVKLQADGNDRLSFYSSMQKDIIFKLNKYKNMFEDSTSVLHYKELSEIFSIDLKKELLEEIERHNETESVTYVLKKKIMNIFENSELLKEFRLSLVTSDEDKQRTKPKRSQLGYISEFVGLNLEIPIDENGKTIIIPIETQSQSIGNYLDSQSSYSAHSKLAGKKLYLKNVPQVLDKTRYTEPKQRLKVLRNYYKECEAFLASLMEMCPVMDEAKIVDDRFGKKCVVITRRDLYESLNAIARYEKGTPEYNFLRIYLENFLKVKDKLIPNTPPPKYLYSEDIPSLHSDKEKYNEFYKELITSIKELYSELEQIESMTL